MDARVHARTHVNPQNSKSLFSYKLSVVTRTHADAYTRAPIGVLTPHAPVEVVHGEAGVGRDLVEALPAVHRLVHHVLVPKDLVVYKHVVKTHDHQEAALKATAAAMSFQRRQNCRMARSARCPFSNPMFTPPPPHRYVLGV